VSSRRLFELLQANQRNSLSFPNLQSNGTNLTIETTSPSGCSNFDALAANVTASNGIYACKTDAVHAIAVSTLPLSATTPTTSTTLTSSATASSTAKVSKPGLTEGARIGISIGIPLLLALLGGVIFVIIRSRRVQTKYPTDGVELPLGGHHEKTELPSNYERWELKADERPAELEATGSDWVPTREAQELAAERTRLGGSANDREEDERRAGFI